MKVDMAETLGTQLQGRPLGRKHFARLCELLSDAPAGEVVLLDFAKVDLVTGSWVDAALVTLLRWAADERNDVFPVICNASPKWLDDLALVAEWTHQVYLVAEGSGPPERAALVGSLDPAQRTTLETLLELHEGTGASVERQRPGEGIKATAWNNRLRDLYEKRLLRREKRGREHVYSPVVREVVLDG
jgi:hypothetical protein